MRTILAIAMIIGSGTFLQAGQAPRHAYLPPHAESFMGSTVDTWRVAPLGNGLGMCNGGACSPTGGPSGGPNQG